ncbi:MAG: hypothetical protein DSM107014_07830 [Gomphosphaeria aponina SAG 52.96 = DSM 107014]|uniref:Uncharacterized protein n=1 Tax=Gomphosphaeria aponina SAG 52.96 = DSM 107014 TaxID=1521640 RepID=A0A941JT19_9CHRO|nr:hypothetical protein [Gomphosphaeria aponina SAG 52.96 = DSM 107014]
MTQQQAIFPLSPLIKITLLSLYLGLTVPLPFLAEFTAVPIPANLFWFGIGLGAVGLYGALSERVILDEEKIQVTYPRFFRFFRSGWVLYWSEIKDLKLRTTGSGGLVYYFITHSAEKAYLLPMRVAGFARMVKLVEEKTGIDTTDIRPLSQPWMYLILLGFTLLLLLVDAWTIWTATTQI